MGLLDAVDPRHPPVEGLVGDEFPVPRGVQRRPRAFLHRQVRRFGRGAKKLRFRSGDVDHGVKADRLGDNAAPPGVEGPHDVAVGFGWRRRSEQKRILELETGEGDAQLRGHGENLRKGPTIAHYNGGPAKLDTAYPGGFSMPRKVIGGLIQAAAPLSDPAAPIARVRQAAIDAHIPLIEEAGRRGVQILGLEEVFNGPYFCPSQDAHWYDLAEPVPGPTTDLMAQYAKKYQMAMVVPVYEREQAGVYYNTAAVYDSDGAYLGKYRKNHIPHTAGFWEKYFFKPGNLGYPVFKTRVATIGVCICYDRHFPEGA